MKFYCKNLKVRTKKGVKYFYCSYLRKNLAENECSCCDSAIYRENKKENKKGIKMQKKEYVKIKGKKHNLTKATEIPKSVKLKVWYRDNKRCIFCGKYVDYELANSHFIKRSHLGLGIEENIMTNCVDCHNKFDDSINRDEMINKAERYFKKCYSNWNKEKLVYRKNSD